MPPEADRPPSGGGRPARRLLGAGAAAAAGLLAVAACGAVEDRDPRAPLIGFHEDIVQVLERVPVPGLSVAVARGDSLLWAHGYGVADAVTGREATARTPYRIASITKTMTAAVLIRLAALDELDLDAPVARYLDDPPVWTRGVTVRQVLSHTSEGPEAGGRFSYSGRYDILGRVAEGASGRPFPELLERLVLEPAGMTSSVAIDRIGSTWMADSLAAPHGPDGEPADVQLPRRAQGGNGVVSTVLDLTRFAAALVDGRIVPPAWRDEAWTPGTGPEGPLPYGLGWFVEPSPAGDLLWHGGQWPTYSGLLLHVREHDLTLAVLANSWHVSHPYYQIGTATVLYNAIAASFLRHLVLASAPTAGSGPVPDMPWGVSADSLAELGRRLRDRYPSSLARFWGAEMIGRGLLHREAGDPERADSLMAAAVACCDEALAASTELGLLFHLGRSEDPRLRRIGQAAGEALVARWPEAVLPRFHLAVSLTQSGEGSQAAPLLESLMDDPAAPGWLQGWATYLRAEQLADDDPERATRLLRRVLDRGVDESGLLDDARALLDHIGG